VHRCGYSPQHQFGEHALGVDDPSSHEFDGLHVGDNANMHRRCQLGQQRSLCERGPTTKLTGGPRAGAKRCPRHVRVERPVGPQFDDVGTRPALRTMLMKQRTTRAPMSQARRRIDVATATAGDRTGDQSATARRESAPRCCQRWRNRWNCRRTRNKTKYGARPNCDRSSIHDVRRRWSRAHSRKEMTNEDAVMRPNEKCGTVKSLDDLIRSREHRRR